MMLVTVEVPTVNSDSNSGCSRRLCRARGLYNSSEVRLFLKDPEASPRGFQQLLGKEAPAKDQGASNSL